MGFQETDIHSLEFNPFDKISKQWMLITAGDEEKSNTMTASWGGIGIMWGKEVATAYIRPQRYTKEFVDREERFTLSFLPEEHRKALNVCGFRLREKCGRQGKKPDSILLCGRCHRGGRGRDDPGVQEAVRSGDETGVLHRERMR